MTCEPRRYDVYSYYCGGLYLVIDPSTSFGGDSVVTLYDLTERKTIAVFKEVFNQEVKCEGKVRFVFSKVDINSLKPDYGVQYLSTDTLISELNSRQEEFFLTKKSDVVDSYYDIGIRLPDCEGGFNFIKRKQAESEEEMKKILYNMGLQSKVSKEFPPSVRKHIVIDVKEPEVGGSENEGETDIFTF